MSALLLVVGIILFVLLVVIHELGHFLAARRNGVEVEEFGIGFPPRAKVLGRRHGTIYSLNWLPIGGFVKLKGEHDIDTRPGSYGAARLKTKIKIMLAGVIMNLLAAFALLALLAICGMPQLVDKQFTVKNDTKIIKHDVMVGYVEPNSPAAKAGLGPADRLVSIGSSAETTKPIVSAEQLPSITKQLAGHSVHISYTHSGQPHEVNIPLRSQQEVTASLKTDNPKGYLGISPTDYILQRSTWSAPVLAVGLIGQFSAITLHGLASAIANLVQGNTGAASAQVSGPVGIFELFKNGSILGYQFVLMLVAVISLTLAIMNVLPIPALDGGKLFVTLLFRVLKRPLTEHAENVIYGTGFAVLMLLVVLITIVDVKRFF